MRKIKLEVNDKILNLLIDSINCKPDSRKCSGAKRLKFRLYGYTGYMKSHTKDRVFIDLNKLDIGYLLIGVGSTIMEKISCAQMSYSRNNDLFMIKDRLHVLQNDLRSMSYANKKDD